MLQEKVRACMESAAVFGLSTSESLASYDPDTSLWKTCQLSLEGESIEFSGTWPASGMVRNGKLYSRQTLGCLIVANESLLLPTPTRSFGVNARGWGLSQTGRRRYSEAVEENAKRFGYRPPIALLEWMMGFPENHTAIELAASGMPLSLRQQSGLQSKSSNIIDGLALTSDVGLSLAKDLSYAEWEQVGFKLANFGRSMQWWIGDWINYGSKKYGETYKAAIEATGFSYSTVSKFSSISSSFEFCRRRQNLTFRHHAEVLGLDNTQQDELLEIAETEGWSCNRLREEVRKLKNIGQQVDNERDESKELDSEHSETIDVDWSKTVIEAFSKVENRLETVRNLVQQFTEAEKQVLRDWLAS